MADDRNVAKRATTLKSQDEMHLAEGSDILGFAPAVGQMTDAIATAASNIAASASASQRAAFENVGKAIDRKADITIETIKSTQSDEAKLEAMKAGHKSIDESVQDNEKLNNGNNWSFMQILGIMGSVIVAAGLMVAKIADSNKA